MLSENLDICTDDPNIEDDDSHCCRCYYSNQYDSLQFAVIVCKQITSCCLTLYLTMKQSLHCQKVKEASGLKQP